MPSSLGKDVGRLFRSHSKSIIIMAFVVLGLMGTFIWKQEAQDIIPKGISAFPAPPRSVMTVIKDHEEILGGPSYFLSHDGADDWISVHTQTRKIWFHDDWLEMCRLFEGHRGLGGEFLGRRPKMANHLK